jgi:hypothetical protein
MLREDATLQGVALLARHRRDVERIRARGLVSRLLKLTAVDELHIGDRRPSRLSGISVLEAAPKSGQNLRPIVVERAGCAFADPRMGSRAQIVPAGVRARGARFAFVRTGTLVLRKPFARGALDADAAPRPVWPGRVVVIVGRVRSAAADHGRDHVDRPTRREHGCHVDERPGGQCRLHLRRRGEGR